MTTALRWQLLALALLVGVLLWLLAPVLTPFAIAAMFAYLFDPVVERLQRLRLGRGTAVGIVFLALTALLILVLLWLVPYLQRQVATLIRRLPDWIDWVQTDAVPWLNAKLDLDLESPDAQQLAAVLQQHWKEAGGLAATILARVSRSGFALVTWGVHVLVVPVAFYYLLRDWRGMIHHGAIFFGLEKLGAVLGVSNLHIYAAMRGETLEKFQKTRNAPGALYSVAPTEQGKNDWKS